MDHLIACAFWFCGGAALRCVFGRVAAHDARKQIERLAKELGSTEQKRAAASSEVHELQRRVAELQEWRDEDRQEFDARVSQEARDHQNYHRDEEEELRRCGWLPCASCGTWRAHTDGPVCMTCVEHYRELATASRRCGTQTTWWN